MLLKHKLNKVAQLLFEGRRSIKDIDKPDNYALKFKLTTNLKDA